MRPILTIGTVVALLAAACGGGSEGGGDGRASVVAGFYPLAEAAQRIGGDLRLGHEPDAPGGGSARPRAHTRRCRGDRDLRRGAADLGGGFQPAVEEGAAASDGMVVDVLAVADATMPAPPSAADDGLSVDPHVWLDPRRWADVVRTLGTDLAEILPASCDATANADAYAARARGPRLPTSPRGSRPAIGRRSSRRTRRSGTSPTRTGSTQEAITGILPEAEPSAQRLAELRDLVEREGVTTIFTEDLVAPDVAETLAAEAGVQIAMLHTLEGLTDDQRAAGADYRSVMRENLATLEEALGCG